MKTPTLRVLSLGAGLDSTTLLLLSERGILPRLDAAIFADTMAEPQHVYDTLEWLMAATSIPILRISAGDLTQDILAAATTTERLKAGRIGQPPFWVRNDPNPHYATADGGGQLWRKCTVDYKIVPIRQKIREMLGIKRQGRVAKDVRIEQ